MRKKYNTPHRRHVVKTRMTDEEYADFTGRLAAYEISQSEFIRQAIRKATIRPIVTVSPVNDGLLAALSKLTAEYGKIGGNLNQIARSLNEYGSPYRGLEKEVRGAAADLAALKFEVLQKVGEAVGDILFYDKLQNTFMLWGKIQMTDAQQKAAAKQFVKDWTDHGDEKQETQRFWIALLQNVFGVEQATNAIEFEVPVKLGHTSFIDGYLKDTNVLIEQKGADIDLRKGYKQSDGSMLTPFQQARRYAGYLPHNMNPRWIVVCNFKEFHIHDMNRPNDTPEVIALAELEKEYPRLQFLVDTGNERIQKEMQISLQAGELVGKLYDSLLIQYKNPSNPASLKSLNMLCVRLVFCLYAEDGAP